MTSQPVLFDVATVPSPLCCYEKPCPKQGRAVYGPEEAGDGCVNRSITCLTCGSTGVASRNLTPTVSRRKARAAA